MWVSDPKGKKDFGNEPSAKNMSSQLLLFEKSNRRVERTTILRIAKLLQSLFVRLLNNFGSFAIAV